MKMVFKSYLFLILLFFNIKIYACSLNPQFNYAALSGPVTQLLYEIGLLKDNKLKIISQFSGIDAHLTNAEVVVGGINISPEFLKRFDDLVIFFDEAAELQKIFSKFQSQNSLKVKKIIKIITKDRDPFTEVRENIKELTPYLTSCEKELKKIDELLKTTEKVLIDQKVALKIKQLFFLGEIDFKYGKLPPLLMLNDGPIRYLLQKKLIESYDSPLSYPSWSTKKLRELEVNPVIYIGLNGSKLNASDNPRTFVINKLSLKAKHLFNIYNSGLLVPGISQVYFLQEWNRLASTLPKF